MVNLFINCLKLAQFYSISQGCNILEPLWRLFATSGSTFLPLWRLFAKSGSTFLPHQLHCLWFEMVQLHSIAS